MISFLEGKLVESLPTQVTVDVNGVGYEVLIPLSSFDKLPSPGHSVKLLTHLAVREDAHVLYGFMTSSEREMFRLLVNNVSGIGPKIALCNPRPAETKSLGQSNPPKTLGRWHFRAERVGSALRRRPLPSFELRHSFGFRH